MNGLRVYTRTLLTNLDNGSSVFYSRRGSGPIYQWLFDERLSVWRCSRLTSSDLTAQSFDIASWKSLPRSLQTRLSEHYVE
jgi:hypothetical protein